MSFLKSPAGIVISVAVLVLGLGTVLFLTSPAEGPARPDPMGMEYPEVGRDHIEPGEPHAPYNSNPPTSGPHLASPANIGFYQDELIDEQILHNLEHGQIWASYKIADEATLDELRSYQARHTGSVIVTKRSANEQNICLASWTRLLCLDTWDLEIAEDFVKANINDSPEPLAR